MKVEVDQKKCETVGICVKELPEVFEFQPGSKKARAKVEVVPHHLEVKCVEVARKCPTGAIRISKE